MTHVLDQEVNRPFRILGRHRSICSLDNLARVLSLQSDEDMLANWQSQKLVGTGKSEAVDERVVVDAFDVRQSDRFPDLRVQERCVYVAARRSRRCRLG